MAYPFRQRSATPGPPESRKYQPPPPTPPLSEFSSPAVSNCGWASENFMLGAGMVIIQPSSHKVVVVHDSRYNYWFLPKGRKDIGESLEAAALREAYEESGHQVEFLPLYTPTHAPPPPADPSARIKLNTEPVYMTLSAWRPGQGNRKSNGEYLTSWYVGQIPADSVRKDGTGMANEQTYSSHLSTYDEAMELLYGAERDVLRYAWAVYEHTLDIQEKERRREARKKHRSDYTATKASPMPDQDGRPPSRG
ncbi:putative NUDIX domain containing protein [Lyophyllum shimeji]|uniref:NUDIX domain containing protein n=1 Tax=Lyophyllum shimeji TaxID=47721 RepID=A0A9P3PZK7_LYOSH|nr:putative NUDIX domain containing protein [Lyophyllum shimeji]